MLNQWCGYEDGLAGIFCVCFECDVWCLGSKAGGRGPLFSLSMAMPLSEHKTIKCSKRYSNNDGSGFRIQLRPSDLPNPKRFIDCEIYGSYLCHCVSIDGPFYIFFVHFPFDFFMCFMVEWRTVWRRVCMLAHCWVIAFNWSRFHNKKCNMFFEFNINNIIFNFCRRACDGNSTSPVHRSL